MAANVRETRGAPHGPTPTGARREGRAAPVRGLDTSVRLRRGRRREVAVVEQHRFTHHMSDEDALMWNIEKDPILRSTILAVAVFERVPDWRRLRDRIELATRVIPRMRQRVCSPPLRLGPPRWTVEPSFDLDFHVRRVRLPEPGDRAALLRALEPIAASAFDRARPLWEFTLFEGLRRADGGEAAALAMKVHHSVTDGVGGMTLLSELVDFTSDAPAAALDDDAPEAPAGESLGAAGLVRDSLAHTRRRLLGITSRLPGTVAGAAVGAARHPGAAASNVLDTARSIVKLLTPATSPMSPVMRERGLGRRLAMFEVPLDDVRRAGKAAEASVNDVFVSAVVGGLQRYHAHHGYRVDALRMTLPINLRTAADAPGGNKFVPARFAVPAGVSDPAERIRAIGAIVREWRGEPALALTGALAGALNRLPTAVTTALFGSMLKGCDFIATNVPGSPVPVYVGGARVEGLYAFAPPSGAACNVALISHVDTCCIGIVIDRTAVPDDEVLVRCIREGFDEVLALGQPLAFPGCPPPVTTRSPSPPA
jgi:WS/DGAT/MGAT family acyltransferase